MTPTGIQRFTPGLMVILSLFFVGGMMNSLNDVLIGQFKQAFTLTDLEAALIQSVFLLGYFFFAIPAALFIRRHGYQRAIVLGLCLCGLGAAMFLPAAQLRTYVFFLGALFTIAAGLTFLEMSNNPLMVELGGPERAEQRVNFGQAFNPLGSITGIVVGQVFILSGSAAGSGAPAVDTVASAAWRAAKAHAAVAPYMGIAAFFFLWAWTASRVVLPAPVERGGEPREGLSVLRRYPYLAFSFVAQFCYIGAQVAAWSFLIRYAQDTVPTLSDRSAAHFLTLSLVLFVAGRFGGTALMSRFAPARLLSGFAIAAFGLTAVAVLWRGYPGLIAIAASSFFMSIMAPTIIGISLRPMGRDAPMGITVLIMAISGGAGLAAAMGHASDLYGIAAAYVVPMAAYAVVLLFGIWADRHLQSGPDAAR